MDLFESNRLRTLAGLKPLTEQVEQLNEANLTSPKFIAKTKQAYADARAAFDAFDKKYAKTPTGEIPEDDFAAYEQARTQVTRAWNGYVELMKLVDEKAAKAKAKRASARR